ncbi:winged helix-turn-helix domain-containing protein [Roseicella aquatilis]|uniref:Helix-turn-helix domain-containing protein n=1 Tax=Roseicella aquatilis TaxID=2527868 RepID=A0A4R4DPQ3_9PROT|nr:helix-turn-helix domain-containing protein [Roseicella aquatilis]TCZ63919.1 helix-turn-helix domain-containing protein [Roseicella aquatilis]
MGSALTDSLPTLLLRRSAAGPEPILAGRDAAPFFGTAFNRLLAKGVLTELPPAASWPPCRGCTCGFGERPITEIDGTLVAECPDDADASVTLQPHDLRAFSIDVTSLVALLAAGTGWPDAPEPLGTGVWRLGDLADGRAVVLILDPLAFRAPALSSILRAAPPPSSTILLVPPGVDAGARRPFLDMRYHLVGLLEASHPTELRLLRDRLEPRAGGAAQLDEAGMLLTINVMGITASFHGVPLRLRGRDFDVLAVLAREAADGRALAQPDDLLRALAGREDGPEPIAGEQLEKSISRIREALCGAAGLPREEGRKLIVNVPRRGYRLASPPIRVVLG